MARIPATPECNAKNFFFRLVPLSELDGTEEALERAMSKSGADDRYDWVNVVPITHTVDEAGNIQKLKRRAPKGSPLGDREEYLRRRRERRDKESPD